jgi:hypothetical protein
MQNADKIVVRSFIKWLLQFNRKRRLAKVFSAKNAAFMRRLTKDAIFILTGIGGHG